MVETQIFRLQSFSGKKSLPVKNSYLQTFYDDKAKILAVFMSKLYCALLCLIVLSIVLIFSLTVTL